MSPVAPAPVALSPRPLPAAIAPKVDTHARWAEAPLVLVRAELDGSTKMFPKANVFRAAAAPFLDAKSAVDMTLTMNAMSSQSPARRPIGFASASAKTAADAEPTALTSRPMPSMDSDAVMAQAKMMQSKSPKFIEVPKANSLDDAVKTVARKAAKSYESGTPTTFAILEDGGKFFSSRLTTPDGDGFLITPNVGGHKSVSLEILNPSVKAVVDAYSEVRAVQPPPMPMPSF